VKFNDLNIKIVSCIQIILAVIISVIFSFVVPLEWHPATAKEIELGISPSEVGGLGPISYHIFTLSQWYFSFSIVWVIKRDNPYLNNYLVVSFVPLVSIIIWEFIFLGLYYDYIHILPAIISFYILWKKTDTLEQKLMIIYACIYIVWFNIVWILELAYGGALLLIVILLFYVYPLCFILFSFYFRERENE